MALMGAAAMALCPFVLHEIMFTCQTCGHSGLLISFSAGSSEAPGAFRGYRFALGYLFHPLALLWTPWIGLWAIRTREPNDTGDPSPRGAAFAIPLLAWSSPGWPPATGFKSSPDRSSRPQSPSSAIHLGRRPAGAFARWLHSRWMNFSNTFLPFWLHFFHEGHADLNSVYGIAGPLVKFAFSWWNTLPLGMGLLLWPSVRLRSFSRWGSFPIAISVFILRSGGALCLYWGDKSTGLMRECGHPLVLR